MQKVAVGSARKVKSKVRHTFRVNKAAFDVSVSRGSINAEEF